MFYKLFRSLFFAILFIGSPAAYAEEMCPPSIEVTESLKTPLEGWTVGQNKVSADLMGITMFSGPPEEEASLVPTGKDATDSSMLDTWPLDPDEHGYWLQCNYANTRVTIAKKLDAKLKYCQIKYMANVEIGGNRAPESVTCR